MKTKNLFRFAFIIAIFSIQNLKVNAFNSSAAIYNSNNAITFVENGITFSVFQNGEFDFFLNTHSNNLGVNYYSPNVSISFNSGYNYNRFVQYGQFGAVIQVERTPVFYDHYGRVTSIGDININYRHGNLHRVGGLHIHYNSSGHYVIRNGYINSFNRNYTYHPHHNLFIRPYAGYRVVRSSPYRHHYSATRHHYYNDHRYAYKHHYDHHRSYTNKRATHQKQYRSKNNVHTNDYGSRTIASSHKSPSHRNDYSYTKGHSKKDVSYSNSAPMNSKSNRNFRVKETTQRNVSADNRNNYAVKTTSVEKNKLNNKNRNNSRSSHSPRVQPSSSNQKGNATKYLDKKNTHHKENRRSRS